MGNSNKNSWKLLPIDHYVYRQHSWSVRTMGVQMWLEWNFGLNLGNSAWKWLPLKIENYFYSNQLYSSDTCCHNLTNSIWVTEVWDPLQISLLNWTGNLADFKPLITVILVICLPTYYTLRARGISCVCTACIIFLLFVGQNTSIKPLSQESLPQWKPLSPKVLTTNMASETLKRSILTWTF